VFRYGGTAVTKAVGRVCVVGMVLLAERLIWSTQCHSANAVRQPVSQPASQKPCLWAFSPGFAQVAMYLDELLQIMAGAFKVRRLQSTLPAAGCGLPAPAQLCTASL